MFSPSDFYYTLNNVKILVNNSGHSKQPNINWNGQEGVFSFLEAPTKGITIHPENGVIQWVDTLEVDTYKLRVKATNSIGEVETNFTLIIDPPQEELIKNYKLFQNYPNPTDGITYFTYRLSLAGDISISINTLDGRLIHLPIINQFKERGIHTLKINVSGLSSGVYHLRIKSSTEGIKTRMFVVE